MELKKLQDITMECLWVLLCLKRTFMKTSITCCLPIVLLQLKILILWVLKSSRSTNSLKWGRTPPLNQRMAWLKPLKTTFKIRTCHKLRRMTTTKNTTWKSINSKGVRILLLLQRGEPIRATISTLDQGSSLCRQSENNKIFQRAKTSEIKKDLPFPVFYLKVSMTPTLSVRNRRLATKMLYFHY